MGSAKTAKARTRQSERTSGLRKGRAASTDTAGTLTSKSKNKETNPNVPDDSQAGALLMGLSGEDSTLDRAPNEDVQREKRLADFVRKENARFMETLQGMTENSQHSTLTYTDCRRF